MGGVNDFEVREGLVHSFGKLSRSLLGGRFMQRGASREGDLSKGARVVGRVILIQNNVLRIKYRGHLTLHCHAARARWRIKMESSMHKSSKHK